MNDVTVPAAVLATIEPPRGICARTGRPATRTEKVRAGVAMAWWQAPLVVGAAYLGVGVPLGRAGEHVTFRLPVSKRVQRRRSLFAVSIVVLGVAAVMFLMWPYFEPSPLSFAAAAANVALLVAAVRAYVNAWVRAAATS